MPSPAPTERWTLGRLLHWTTDHFSRLNLDEPRLRAEILLAHVLNCQRVQLYTRFDETPADDVRTAYRDLVQQAARRTPVAYLVGYKEFYSLRFTVTPDVLIPRPETETLVDRAVDWCTRNFNGSRQPNIWDLGTGSGCIIIAILASLRQARGTATDISEAALAVAEINARNHDIHDRLTLLRAEGLNLPVGSVPDGGFDVIVSNPPYVSEKDLQLLDPGVRDHEPRIALSPGGDGLDVYRIIAAGAADLLHAAGQVWVEIGAGQCQAVRGVFERAGRFRHAGTHRGGSDPHDRVLQFAKV